MTIRPTSTATERVFSITGIIKPKVSSNIKFETLFALLFLKSMFVKLK